MLDKEVQPEQTAAAPAVSEGAPQVSEIVDLDGLSKFTFQGEEYNHDKLHKIYSEHKDWSEKIPAYQKSEEFQNNLTIDIENVLNDPRLADRFKATYPQWCHGVLDMFLKNNRSAPAPSNQPAQGSSLPKEFISEFGQVKERLSFFEQRAYQAEVEAASAKLDSILPPLLQKYEMANDDQVYSRAEALLQQGQKLTDKTWERLVRESHEAQQKKADQVYGAKLKKQLEKGQKGQDIGPGGTTPGQAPRKIRTFDEAREAAIQSLTSQRTG